MSDLVERLRSVADASLRDDGSDIPLGQMCREAADALEAAQARIEAVRREAVEECARLCDVFAIPEEDPDPYDDWRMGMECSASRCAAAIRALTEAKEDRT